MSRSNLATLAALLMAAAPCIRAEDLLVTTSNDVVDANDGILSLREAVQQANVTNAPVRIVLPASDCFLFLPGAGEDANASGDLDLTNTALVEFVGTAGSGIDATALGDRILHVARGAQVLLTNIVLRGGSNAVDGGGALWVEGRAQLLGCTLRDNSARRGGAIGVATGYLALTDCVLTSNRTHDGRSGDDGESGEAAGDGGALYLLASTTVVVRTELSTNFTGTGGTGNGITHGPTVYGGAGGAGGAFYCERGHIELADCVVVSNYAGSDGGCLHEFSTANGRARGGDGGAGYVVSADLVVTGSVFVGNAAGAGSVAYYFSLFMSFISCPGGDGGHGGALCIVSGSLFAAATAFRGNTTGAGAFFRVYYNNLLNCDGHGGDGGGVYGEDSVISLTGTLFTDNRAAVAGGSGGAVACSGSLVMTDCDVTGNSAEPGQAVQADGGDGGGVYARGQATFISCRFVHNRAGDGWDHYDLGRYGGVFSGVGGKGGSGGGVCASGEIQVVDCIFDGNEAGKGGRSTRNKGGTGGAGGNLHLFGQGNLARSTIKDGSAREGGGCFLPCWNSGPAPGGNGGSGGGIHLGGAWTISNCTVSANRAAPGGSSPGDLSCFDSPFLPPPGGDGGSGGGIFVSAGTVALSHCTIAENEAGAGGAAPVVLDTRVYPYLVMTGTVGVAGSGGGVAVAGTGCTVSLLNTIVDGNHADAPESGPDLHGSFSSLAYSLVRDPNGLVVAGFSTGSIFGLPARLLPLASNGSPVLTHAIDTCSPARDGGDPAVTNGVDQRGQPRVHGGRTDIGAYEEQNTPGDCRFGSPVVFSMPLPTSYVVIACARDIPPAPLVTATSACGGVAVVLHERTVPGPNSLFIRIWSAVDGCGNSSSIPQIFAVLDGAAPMFFGVPSNQVLPCSDPLPPPPVTATDSCGDTVTVAYAQSASTGCPRVVTRVWTATDFFGNSAAATQTILLVETDADGDGLDYWAEARLGTNPNAADTDGDGRPDGREVARGFDPLSATSFPRAVRNDFDGGGESDVLVYHPASATWYALRTNSAPAQQVVQWGWGATTPVLADFDGDAIVDHAVYHPPTGNWYVRRSSDGALQLQAWGWSAATPVVGDYDGDGRADLAVYHPQTGNWYVRQSAHTNLWLQNWGWNTTVPVTGDYDGDGKADLAVYHPQTSIWYIRQSATSNPWIQTWGWSAATPVPGDYDGDRQTDIAVYDPASGDWYVRRSSDGYTWYQNWGWSTALPAPADYDHDGRTDLAVYHPQSGTWYIRLSSSGALRLQPWGWFDARPVLSPP